MLQFLKDDPLDDGTTRNVTRVLSIEGLRTLVPTINPEPSDIEPQPLTPHLHPTNNNPQPSILNLKAHSTPSNPEPSPLQHSTLARQPSTLDPFFVNPTTFNTHLCTQQPQLSTSNPQAPNPSP